MAQHGGKHDTFAVPLASIPLQLATSHLHSLSSRLNTAYRDNVNILPLTLTRLAILEQHDDRLTLPPSHDGTWLMDLDGTWQLQQHRLCPCIKQRFPLASFLSSHAFAA